MSFAMEGKRVITHTQAPDLALFNVTITDGPTAKHARQEHSGLQWTTVCHPILICVLRKILDLTSNILSHNTINSHQVENFISA